MSLLLSMGHFSLRRDRGGSVAQFFNGRIEAPALSVDGVVVERWNLADEDDFTVRAKRSWRGR